jgi:hypothetical protein
MYYDTFLSAKVPLAVLPLPVVLLKSAEAPAVACLVAFDDGSR